MADGRAEAGSRGRHGTSLEAEERARAGREGEGERWRLGFRGGGNKEAGEGVGGGCRCQWQYPSVSPESFVAFLSRRGPFSALPLGLCSSPACTFTL